MWKSQAERQQLLDETKKDKIVPNCFGKGFSQDSCICQKCMKLLPDAYIGCQQFIKENGRVIIQIKTDKRFKKQKSKKKL